MSLGARLGAGAAHTPRAGIQQELENICSFWQAARCQVERLLKHKGGALLLHMRRDGSARLCAKLEQLNDRLRFGIHKLWQRREWGGKANHPRQQRSNAATRTKPSNALGLGGTLCRTAHCSGERNQRSQLLMRSLRCASNRSASRFPDRAAKCASVCRRWSRVPTGAPAACQSVAVKKGTRQVAKRRRAKGGNHVSKTYKQCL